MKGIALFALAGSIGCRTSSSIGTSTESWQIEPRPFLDVVSASSESHVHSSFTKPIGAVRLDDGSVAVADVHSGFLFFFDKTGRPRQHAQETSFQHLGWIGRCGADSVYVWDMMRRQIVVLNRQGADIRRFSFDEAKDGIPSTVSCSNSGVFAYQQRPLKAEPAPGARKIIRGTQPVILANRQGHTLARIAKVVTGEFVLIGGGMGPRPTGKSTLVAMTQRGIFIGTGDSAAIEGYSLNGVHASHATLPSRRHVVTNGDYAKAVEEVLASVPPQAASAVRPALLALPLPVAHPPYSALLVDSEDMLWLVVSPPDQRTRMLILDSSGQYIAEVQLPVPALPTSIGRDYVLAIHSDVDGRHHVLGFRLHRH